jgi:hypothetical protein
MKILIVIIGIVTFFLPHFASGSDSEVISEAFLDIESLNESKLTDSDLSGFVGRGFEVSILDELGRGNSKIILWDETKSVAVIRDISTGYGNFQRNTLSVQGR